MKRIHIDLQLVEGCAAQGMTQRQAAGEMGLRVQTFEARLREDHEVRAAWVRGRGRQTLEQAAQAVLSAPPERVPAGTRPSLQEAQRRVLIVVREKIRTRAEIREATGLDYSHINDALDQLELDGLVEKIERIDKNFYRRVGSSEQPPDPKADMVTVESDAELLTAGDDPANNEGHAELAA